MNATEGWMALAQRLADAAGTVIRRYFRQPIAVDDKADQSPVTIADREAEQAMRELIVQAYPDHGIFGEEHGVTQGRSGLVWVLDPIDGTRAFITGKPSFGTLIGLWEGERPILGIIDQAILNERWLGVAGRPTTLNGKPVRCRPCDAVSKAALYATAPEMFAGDTAPAFERLRQAVKLPRFGADCYAYALLASGFVDLVAEASLKPYDYAALVPVIEGAGGVTSDWQGRPLTLKSNGTVLAAGDARAHAQALALLRGR
ncbi:MAG: histidinol-phosphatase [Rhodospirillales bacterium]|nr:histidinol-phosphatase [Rhodospirillales bacterium]